MNCPHCGFLNGEDDHRCVRCGRILPVLVIAAPASYVGAPLPDTPPPPLSLAPSGKRGDRVAPPMRRLTAGVMDGAMVILGFATFAAAAQFYGSAFGSGADLWITLSVSLFFISSFYGLVWTIAMRETAGMSWTQLRLVTMDGSPLDVRNRSIRFVTAWLSYCSAGLPLFWALADEESLTFHDHISGTYPSETGGARAVFIKARRG